MIVPGYPVDDWTLAEVQRRVDAARPLAGLLLVGSAARGEMREHSDIDFNALVLHPSPWALPVRDGGREVFFNREGRQVELAFMSLDYVRRRMVEQASRGRRAALDWAEDGIVFAGGGEEFQALRSEAQTILAKGPPEMSANDRAWEIYDTWNLLKDVIDSADEEALCALLAPAAFQQLVRLFFRMSRVWEPRPSAVLTAIARASPEFSDIAHQFLGASTSASIERLQNMAEWLSANFGFQFDVPYQSRPPSG